ncbi:family 43 glycosylhydrolase [Paenibacillus sp. P26]|nr:family 43 glycosylhydrolase [Paenibacillus sp. P26]
MDGYVRRPIHAHGGGMLQAGEYVYWFGENRVGRRRVSCYRSANLKDWEFRGDVLTLDSPFEKIATRTDPALLTDQETGGGANIERPKVIYHPGTGKYVMWMHWENGKDYTAARCAVATCDTVDGDYVYHGGFSPVGHMSRDCTLFVDDDGTAYFISTARDNADLHIYRLSEDYLAIDEHVKTLWPGQYREAPALVKRSGVYFMITSGCTGWHPNQGKYGYAESITGRWSGLYDLGGPTTYDSQPAFILPVQGRETTNYLYIGDRWDAKDYYQSSYVVLPLEFTGTIGLSLPWTDTLSVDRSSGKLEWERKALGNLDS